MSAEEALRENEAQALGHNQIISSVNGKMPNSKPKKWLSFGATGLIVAIVGIVAIIFSSGNLMPSAISERLIEETDVQYADAVESKKIVFQQALLNGEIPEDTAKILKENGVTVGYFKDNVFIESNKTDGELSLKKGDQIITANIFITAVDEDLGLYNAFNNATYSRAAYYYDDEAKRVFKEIGTTRNNYNSNSDFDEVMSNLMGEGSNINVNTVEAVEKIDEKTGEKTIEYAETGTNTKTGAFDFVDMVADKNTASNAEDATLNSADAIKAADTITKEQRSSLFFLAFMENISKMKAGEGSESKINDAMNYLYEKNDTEVVDVNTGEIIKLSGTPLDSPSLYAILSSNKIDVSSVSNFSNDRILKTIQNKLNMTSNNIVRGTIVSTSDKSKGSVGRFITNKSAGTNKDILSVIKPTVESSMVNNSYNTIRGINAGEFLVEGAVNVGKRLAKTSGAAAGDIEAISAYLKLNSKILAMDAVLDRNNRNPLDITSKNTFLGSIIYNVAVAFSKNTTNILGGLKTISNLTRQAAISFLPKSYADSISGYLSNFGECETIKTIGAVGSPQCVEIATFDTSTLNNPFSDTNFINFINENTSLNQSGVRTVKDNSTLAKYILYNNERKTPVGIIDGGIMDSLDTSSKTIPFMSDILSMIKKSLSVTDTNEKIASGAAFVNSKDNPDWQVYKYAQRYVSLARAMAALKQYSSDSTAYNTIKYFEGSKNPVAAFLDSFYASNNNLMITEISN